MTSPTCHVDQRGEITLNDQKCSFVSLPSDRRTSMYTLPFCNFGTRAQDFDWFVTSISRKGLREKREYIDRRSWTVAPTWFVDRRTRVSSLDKWPCRRNLANHAPKDAAFLDWHTKKHCWWSETTVYSHRANVEEMVSNVDSPRNKSLDKDIAAERVSPSTGSSYRHLHRPSDASFHFYEKHRPLPEHRSGHIPKRMEYHYRWNTKHAWTDDEEIEMRPTCVTSRRRVISGMEKISTNWNIFVVMPR